MEQQQHGLSNSTPRAVSDRLQKSTKSLLSLSALQFMSISQISTQKYGSGHFYQFNHKKNHPIGGRLRNYSDKSEHVLRI